MELLTYLKLTLTTDIHSSTVGETLFSVICRPFIVSKYCMTKVAQESHIRWWWGGSIIQKKVQPTNQDFWKRSHRYKPVQHAFWLKVRKLGLRPKHKWVEYAKASLT